MAQTESKIKLIFEGVERGVAAAAAKSSAAVKKLADDNDRLTRAGDKAESALMGIGKGLLAVSSAGSAVSVIGGVAAASTQASGALLLLPGALAAVKIGLGAVEMGAGDFLESMGNLNDNKAFKKNMEAMGDSAKGVAGQIKIAHDSLAEGLGEKMFAGIEAKLKPLIASTLPRLKASYDSIAVSVNRTGLEVLDFLNQSKRQADLNKLIGDSSAIWNQLLESVVPIGAAFLDIAVVGSDMLRKMTGGIGSAAQKFADFIAKARATGQIQKWIEGGVQAFKDMWHIVENVGSTIGSVFRGLGVDMGSPLGMLRDLTERMAEFMKSAGAQEDLRTLGDALKTIGQVVGWVTQTALVQFAKTLVSVAPVAETVAKTFGVILVGALNAVGPIIRAIADVLAEFPFITVAATTALLGFVAVMKTIKAVNAVSELLGLGTAIGGAGDKAKAAEGKVVGFTGKLGLIKGLGAGLAIAAVAVELDKANVAAAGGAEKLQGFEENLHDIVGAAGQVASGDIGGIFADISEDVDTMVEKFKTAQSPIGQFWHWLSGQKPDPIKIDADVKPASKAFTDWQSHVGDGVATANLDADPSRAMGTVHDWEGGVSRTRGVATLDATANPANAVLGGWKGSASATTGVAKLNADPGQAHGRVVEWKGNADRTWATAHLNAEASGAQGVIDGFIRRNDGRQIRIYTSVLGAGGIASAGRLAGGGPVEGPGSGTSDTAGLFALSNGEYVATAKQVDAAGGPEAFGRLMKALERGPVRGFAGGGSIRASAKAAMRTAAPTAAAASGSGSGSVVQFTGNTSDALATVIMGMIRQGKIQIKAA